MGFLKFLFPVCFFWLFWLSGSVDYQHITINQQFLKKKIMSRYNHRIFPVFSFPKLLTVNCYLLSEPQIVFGNCQLSTVTLGIDDIDLSCDMMKNKAQKTWNISLLFVYLQRTMVQIQKINFSYLKDFKEAVCEYRLFFYLYYRLQRNFRVLRFLC